VNPQKRRALCDFYREEFERHIDFLATNGVLKRGQRGQLDHAYHRFLDDLDQVCWRSDFPILAETLLERFETLTRLSELDPRQGH
jgi:hypothetical protein